LNYKIRAIDFVCRYCVCHWISVNICPNMKIDVGPVGIPI